MIAAKVRKYLDDHRIKYVAIVHSAAYTAQETAQSTHVKGRAFAKTVIVRAGPNTVMAVLPATHRIQFERISRVLDYGDVRLATEAELKGLFPDCEPGAMPPFGALYGMRVVCDTSLAASEEITFNACTHNDAIRLNFRDFLTLARPDFDSFASES